MREAEERARESENNRNRQETGEKVQDGISRSDECLEKILTPLDISLFYRI